MKKMIQLGQKGFTLVELMIVVAIIGTLAAVGIPQYARFQAKARQSDAKVTLGAIYTVETTFRAENSTFTTCLANAGFTMPAQSFYAAGFGATGGVVVSSPGQVCTAGTGQSNFSGTRNGAGGAAVAIAQYPLPGAATAAAATFLANANGNVGGTTQDAWTINESQTMTNTVLGF